ncbi:MAG: riboflavin kinase [Bacteroidales bacterium]|jgi:riboflavin kinase/FMN adenylyltransferase|nr:riboflavin kinase [Bacteroidales bacterium]
METYSIFSGIVIHGSKTGRTMGFPTLNIAVRQGNIPNDGVYAVSVFIGNEHYFGIMSIGNRPTFKEDENKTVEIHLLDVTGDWYGAYVNVTPLTFIRSNEKFNSIDELKSQIEKDKHSAKNYLVGYVKE